MAFAKLFETKEYGQILVKIDANDEGDPEVRFFAEPPLLGVCSWAVSFEGMDAWARAEAAFEGVTEEKALKAASHLFGMAQGLVSEDESAGQAEVQ